MVDGLCVERKVAFGASDVLGIYERLKGGGW
jgi:hypothetical protein